MTDLPIDKQALEAALKAIVWEKPVRLFVHDYVEGDKEKVLSAAITAYLAALPSTTDAVGVTVRELEWELQRDGVTWHARSIFGTYAYWPARAMKAGGTFTGFFPGDTGHHRELGSAPRDVAQADYTARIMASLNISEVEPESVLLESACRTLMTKIYNRGHSGLDLDCPLCQAYIAVDRLLAWETGAAPSEEVLAWDRRASPTTSPQAPEGVRDDALEADHAG